MDELTAAAREDVESAATEDLLAMQAEQANIVARRREARAAGTCEHGTSLSLCPECSDLA